MRKIFTACLLLSVFSVNAQNTKPQFTTSVQGGLLEGEQGSAFQLKAINGVQYKKWLAGIGVGLDYYQSRSAPLFLALRHFFHPTTKGLFLYADAGYNFPWLKPTEKDWDYISVKGGFYGEGGVGYQFPLRSKSFLFVSAGYSQKQYTGKYTYPIIIDVYPAPYPASTYEVDYTLRRLSIQAGLRF